MKKKINLKTFCLLSISVFLLPFFSQCIEAKKDHKNYIIVVALESEVIGLDGYAPIVYTGVGKVNATIQLYAAILKYQPDLVINYGSAGGIGGQTGLLKVGTFVQRDMDVRALGLKRGVTPFANQDHLPRAIGIVLGTGDSFVTDATKSLDGLEIDIDLVDMEGYALYRVSQHLGVDFISYKYVSDKADENASQDWQENVSKGSQLFRKELDDKYGNSKNPRE